MAFSENIENECIDTLAVTCANGFDAAFGQTFICKQSGSDCIIDIVIYISYSVRKTDNLTLQSAGMAILLMVYDAISHLKC